MKKIVSAIRSGFSDKAFELLKEYDLHLSERNIEKLFPIIVEFDAVELFVWLLEKSVQRLNFGDTHCSLNRMLSIAFNYASINIIKFIIISEGIDPMILDIKLKLAVTRGHLEVVQYLLLLKDEGTGLCEIDGIILEFAIRSKNIEFIKCILADKRINPSANGNRAIAIASGVGLTEIVKILLSDKRVDPSINKNMPIREAVRGGHTEIVKLLLSDDRVDPVANDSSLMRLASESGHIDIVKILIIDGRIDPTFKSNESLRRASQFGQLEIVRLLMTLEKVDPSANNDYAIIWASKNGHDKVVELLLQDERIKSSSIIMALMEACIIGYTEVVKILISDKRFNLIANKEDIRRAIDVSKSYRSLDVVKILKNIKF